MSLFQLAKTAMTMMIAIPIIARTEDGRLNPVGGTEEAGCQMYTWILVEFDKGMTEFDRVDSVVPWIVTS